MELPSTEPLLERLRRVLAPHYAIERELGAGGMGVVYLGTDVALARPVAIKVLRPGPASLQINLRSTREARLLARLQAGEVDIVVGAEARLRRARLALDHDVQAACPPLRRVRDLWSDAEPGLASRQIADSLVKACP